MILGRSPRTAPLRAYGVRKEDRTPLTPHCWSKKTSKSFRPAIRLPEASRVGCT